MPNQQKTWTSSSGTITYWFDDTHPEVLRGLSLGIPMERMERFIRRNQGDYYRMISGLAGDEGGTLYPQAAAAVVDRDAISLAPTSGSMMIAGYDDAPIDRDLIATIPTSTVADSPEAGGIVSTFDAPGATELGWRDVLGGIATGIGGIFGVPVPPNIFGGFGGGDSLQRPQLPAPRLPMPGGAGRPPALPPARPPSGPVGGGRPSFKLSPYLNPRTGRNIPWSKVAKIGAAAAALGITVEQYIANYGVPRATPRMNPLNARALARGMRRTEAFACFARRAMSFGERYRPGPKRRGCKKRKACR